MTKIELNKVDLNIPLISVDRITFPKSSNNKVGGVLNSSNNIVTSVKALTNISLKFKSGDKVGLIGPNGAGKSCLLKLIAGVYSPTAGKIIVQGKIFPLLNSQVGMNLELTGLDNLKTIGLYFGLKKKIIEKSLNNLIDFTDLGDFIHLPAKKYSSGMLIRLGFAVTTLLNPEILLLDEMIAAGDMHFAEKASNKRNKIVEKSKIIILATHNIEMMKKICNKAIYMEHGKIIYSGKVNECFDLYRSSFDSNAKNLFGDIDNVRKSLKT